MLEFRPSGFLHLIRRHLIMEAGDGERHNGFAANGIDIEGIRGRNPSIVKWVVHDGHKEIVATTPWSLFTL